jgi:hypothetical protein
MDVLSQSGVNWLNVGELSVWGELGECGYESDAGVNWNDGNVLSTDRDQLGECGYE